uniref:Neurotransmitter-gated ion-channel transmembrane domain-containing protein n=1 Tax=Ditylenchus dipsaci TaxID=166011 RepID=A0A915EWR1_9BILA
MTFVMNIITILVTVIIINIYFRGPTTHVMPPWVKTIFFVLALFLMMRRPQQEEIDGRKPKGFSKKTHNGVKSEFGKSYVKNKYLPGEFIEMSQAQIHHPHCTNQLGMERNASYLGRRRMSQPAIAISEDKLLSKQYITEHLRRDDLHKKIREEWKYVAMVIDRLLLYVFCCNSWWYYGNLVLSSNVFEYVNQTSVIEHLKKSAEAEMVS